MVQKVSICSVFFPGGMKPLVPSSRTPANLFNGLSVYSKNTPELSVLPPVNRCLNINYCSFTCTVKNTKKIRNNIKQYNFKEPLNCSM